MVQEYLRSKQPLFTPEELGERADMAAGVAREASSVEKAGKGYWTAMHFARERAANPRKQWQALLLRWARVVSTHLQISLVVVVRTGFRGQGWFVCE